MMAGEKATLALLESQKNAVFLRVQGSGFDPAAFRWQTTKSTFTDRGTVDVLVHDPSEYFFAFDLIPSHPISIGPTEDRASFFSPGPEHRLQRADSFGWEDQLRVVTVWLGALRREVETVSLWDTFGSEPARELAEANLSNKPLNKAERQAIQLRVTQVRAYLRANVGDSARLARVEKKLDDLDDASKRLGKKDFANLALGILMTVAFEAALSSQQAQEVVNIFFAGLRALLTS